MYCIYCGQPINEDSVYCPFCGKSQKMKESIFCPKCGSKVENGSTYCPYCGSSLRTCKKSEKISSSIIKQKIPYVNIRHFVTNRFFLLYILWLLVNTLLLCKSDAAYSNYFNSTNVSRDHWLSSDKGIYPEDWLYPFKNIFSGIMGQAPVYVYDLSEFILYTIIIPAILSLCMYNRTIIFKTEKASFVFYWTVWYFIIWMIIVFPMGLFGLDFLGWSFMMGGLIVGIFSYKKTFAKLYGK